MSRIIKTDRTGPRSFASKVDYSKPMSIQSSLQAMTHPPVDDLEKIISARRRAEQKGNRHSQSPGASR